MAWYDRLLGKPKTPSTQDPVGPIGGSMQPVDPLVTAPYISPGNPGGTYSPMPRDIQPIETVQQSPLNSMGLPENPAYGSYNQVVAWPTEVHKELHLAPAPVKGKGPNPYWTPEDGNRHDLVDGRISYTFNRPWHLAPRLDGNRTFFEASDMPVPGSEGFVGLRAAPRASMFVEPAPWGTNVIVTDAASGTPTQPGNARTPSAVSVSSSQFAGSNNRSYRLT